jgi:hypothetical protein
MKKKLTGLLLLLALLLTGCSRGEVAHVARFDSDTQLHKWAVSELNPDLPADWSGFEYLTFDIKTSSTQRFFINLYDAEGMRRLRILPFQGAWVRASIPLVHFQHRNVVGASMSSIGQAGMHGFGLGFTGSVGSINSIDSLGFELNQPIGSPTIEIRNVRLTMAPEDAVLDPVPVVDEFGQWIPADWPGKANTLDELKAAWAAEEKELQAGELNVSKYGGFLGTRVAASGFFRVENIDGKWWFVDPEGHLFFSTGSCGIGLRAYSRVEGREYLYAALPPAEVTRPEIGVGETCFYSWNLYRRFGPDWYQKWMDMTVRRLDDWGINTIGNWSDATLGGSGRKPYVVQLGGWGFDARTMGMPDVYAPGYAAMVDASAARQCAPLRDDPYLLGYFVGNEPPWPGRWRELVNVILNGDETPMQNALNKHLAVEDTPERRQAFVYDTYTKFMTIIGEAIKRHDPNHLNLGFRFGGNPPDELTRASAKVGFDVFSINIYGYSINNDLLNKIDDLTGLPVIIGEFHFGVPGRGLSPGLRQTVSQEERGVAYRYYVENAAAHPSVIGTHWFIWMDQAPTGRGDGENYNIGLVDVTDRPYKELIDAARETFYRIPDIHSGRIQPVSRQPLAQ